MLSIDILRPILRFLKEETLLNLFYTFDKRVQSLLVHPNMIPSLSLIRLQKDQKVLARYFMWAIREVDRLEIDDKCLSSIHDLATLNPRHLEFRGPLSSKHLWRMAYLCIPGEGIPSFATLTPRLVSLNLRDFAPKGYLRTHWKCATFPETLTELVCPCEFPLRQLWDLPSSLLYLTLSAIDEDKGSVFLLDEVFRHFTRLERLCLNRCSHSMTSASSASHDPIIIPASLTSLEFHTMDFIEHPIDLLMHDAFEQSSIASLVITSSKEPDAPLDFLMAPKTLTSLHLDLQRVANSWRAHWDTMDLFSHLPDSLTHFFINLEVLRNTKNVDLTQLTLLEHFEILHDRFHTTPFGYEDDDCEIELRTLPRLPTSLTALVIRSPLVNCFEIDEIRSLPPNLLLLVVPHFAGEYIGELSSVLPKCKLIAPGF